MWMKWRRSHKKVDNLKLEENYEILVFRGRIMKNPNEEDFRLLYRYHCETAMSFWKYFWGYQVYEPVVESGRQLQHFNLCFLNVEEKRVEKRRIEAWKLKTRGIN